MRPRTIAVIRRPTILTRRLGRRAQAQGSAFWLIVVNGVLGKIAATMLQAGGVVGAFLMALTGDERAVGVAVSFGTCLFLTPQYFFSQMIARRSQRMPFYRIGSYLAITSLAIATTLVLVLAEHPQRLAVAFTLAFGLYYVVAAFKNVPFQDILARTIPERQRGALWGTRFALGGIACFGLGFFVRWMVGRASPVAFPQNYALLFGLGLVLFLIGQSIFMQVKEPVAEPSGGNGSPREMYGRAREMLRGDRNLRRYMLFRFLNAMAFAPVQFLVPAAMKELGDDGSVVGTMISVGVLSAVTATYFWSRISDTTGNRLVLLRALLLRAIALALAAVAVLVKSEIGAALTILIAARCVSDVALAGMQIGNPAYVAEMCSSKDRPYYIGLVNTLSGPLVVFTPLACGFLAPVVGYAPVFLTGALAATGCCFAIRRLEEPRLQAAAHEAYRNPLAAAAG